MRAEQLVLYHYDNCPYCGRVERTLATLNLHIAKKDILEDPVAMRELLAARGLKTVPVLLINNDDGSQTWIPESSDIVRFLQREFHHP